MWTKTIETWCLNGIESTNSLVDILNINGNTTMLRYWWIKFLDRRERERTTGKYSVDIVIKLRIFCCRITDWLAIANEEEFSQNKINYLIV